MKSLDHRESYHLLAAEGWLDLGNPEEAQKELNHILPDRRRHPDVLDLQWHILSRQKQWNDCVKIADALIKIRPERVSGWIHRSFALHELKLTQDAYDNLVGLIKKFPEEPVLSYNLACYCCQMDRLDEAKSWLDNTFKKQRGAQMLHQAMNDPDLRPLWSFLRGERSPIGDWI